LAAPSFAADLSALLRTLPGLRTPAAERAAWFERKAELLDQADAADLAEAARAQAARIRREATGFPTAFPQASPLVDPGTTNRTETRP
jgi:hypothetical protein